MAFSIPAQAFLSFSAKQAYDSLWRMCRQWEEGLWDSDDSQQNKKMFLLYLKTLKGHENPELTQLAHKLQDFSLENERDLQEILMFLERELKKDIAEDEFLISTEDTPSQKSQAPKERNVHVVLDNLRSSFNVGSIFRSAEAFGATKIHLCGYTATPENSKTAKAALGAHDWVSWQYWENTLECLESLKQDGFEVFAFETAEGAKPLSKCNPTPKVALLLGNERYGLASPTLKRADTLVEIPLKGRKNSLNVGVCGALALEHFLRD